MICPFFRLIGHSWWIFANSYPIFWFLPKKNEKICLWTLALCTLESLHCHWAIFKNLKCPILQHTKLNPVSNTLLGPSILLMCCNHCILHPPPICNQDTQDHWPTDWVSSLQKPLAKQWDGLTTVPVIQNPSSTRKGKWLFTLDCRFRVPSFATHFIS